MCDLSRCCETLQTLWHGCLDEMTPAFKLPIVLLACVSGVPASQYPYSPYRTIRRNPPIACPLSTLLTGYY
jgi:hypothetical protein